jgi:UDP-N-acetylglucosamine--N-acetylmuramyl-(pentapeptide) pyrophosphoryl-undecaprenol N-acetylglucosamine transferase
MPERKLHIIISGGGTGGHIFPAIAIADALKKAVPDAEILFVGASGKMEMEKVPAAGYQIVGIPVRGLQRRLTLSNLAFPFRLLASLLKARSIIRRFKPDVVVGVGGYASGPLLRMAVGANIPAVIQEQNSYPGITNKMLAKKVNRICVAYEGMEKYFPPEKLVLCGNPVRNDMLSISGKKKEAAVYFDLDPNQKTLLVTGGSLGAKTINESIQTHLDLLIENGLQVIWQCGKNFYPLLGDLIPEVSNKGVRIMEFISRMDLAYSLAGLVVSRAGAIALAELCVSGKPAILVPSPNVAEDHQTHNAMALVSKDAAVLVKDTEAREKLGNAIIELMNDGEKMQSLSVNIKKMAFTGSAERIAEEVLAVANIKSIKS